MKLKIIADGSRKGAKVVDAKSGETVDGITGIKWNWAYGNNNGAPWCELTLESVPLEAEFITNDCPPEKEVL